MLRLLAAVLLGLVLVALPRTTRAAPPAADLIGRLSVQASQFEIMRTHASFTLEGRLEGVDDNGKTDSVKEGKGRAEADGKAIVLKILKYVEDGEDKTEEAKKKQRERKPDKKKRDIRMPFLAAEQARYAFDQIAVDANDATRVKITFTPKAPEEDTIQGFAWVDTRTGTVVSTEFKLSKTPMFVDYVLFNVEFNAPTALGPGISKVTMEGKGGILFIRKRFRGVATFSDYAIVP